MHRWSGTRAILIGGSVAGALDILFAISFAGFNGVAPQRLLQIVASGLLGESSFSGGASTAALGLILHFMLAFVFASMYLLASRRIPVLPRNTVLAGALFGIGVFLTMRLLVLPLSAYPYPVTFKPLATALDLLSHMILFGIPISLAARKASIQNF
jgi:uncharacterized membrane protein YagU involved in acid resistance